MAVMASLSGALSDKIGSRIPATAGMAILSCGLFLLSWMDLTTPLPLIAAGLAVVGLGIGLFTSPNNSSVLGAVGPERRGVASGILSTARTLGNVLGIGATGAVYATALVTLGGGGSGRHRPGDRLRAAVRQRPGADRGGHVGYAPRAVPARPLNFARRFWGHRSGTSAIDGTISTRFKPAEIRVHRVANRHGRHNECPDERGIRTAEYP